MWAFGDKHPLPFSSLIFLTQLTTGKTHPCFSWKRPQAVSLLGSGSFLLLSSRLLTTYLQLPAHLLFDWGGGSSGNWLKISQKASELLLFNSYYCIFIHRERLLWDFLAVVWKNCTLFPTISWADSVWGQSFFLIHQWDWRERNCY